MSIRLLRAAIVALPLALPLISLASAQPAPIPEFAREGDFTLTYYFANVTPANITPVPGGDNRTAVVNVNVAWLVNSAGSGFGHLMTGHCMNQQRSEGGVVVESHGNCVYTDREGDQLFERTDRMPGDTFTTGQWIGGTGKYAGVSSTFEIRGVAIEAGRSELGYRMTLGVKTGHYTLPPL